MPPRQCRRTQLRARLSSCAFSPPAPHATVVETASLSSLVPPKTKHKLRLCAKAITQGLLTSVQVPPSPRWGVSCPRAGALLAGPVGALSCERS